MVLRRLLERLAAGAPVPVFAIAGAGAREAVQDLRLHRALRLVDTPREANVLLVAGFIPESLANPFHRAHDAMSYPRCTVVWGKLAALAPITAALPEALVVDAEQDLGFTLVHAHRRLLSGERPSERPILPDLDPAPWRGVGPYGQGGGGMTGGTPYGRPMAGLVDDRDGLRLDALPLRIGPFFPRFPSGFVIDATLAGDVIIEATIAPNPFIAGDLPTGEVRPGLRPFLRALSEPVSIAELELTRAQEHLRWIADALITHGLFALGSRVLGLVSRVQPGDGDEVRRLTRLLEWTQVLRWSTGGVAPIEAKRLAGLGAGPVARASGLAEDARVDDAAYGELGFEPLVQTAGDSAARWRQRLAEAAQALDLAARAGVRRTRLEGRVECPRGRLEPGSAPTARLLEFVPDLVVGREWGDAVATIVSLDLDLEEAAVAKQLSARTPAP